MSGRLVAVAVAVAVGAVLGVYALGGVRFTLDAQPVPTPTATPAAAADPNANCTIIVPRHPLTARGLATPYQFTATDPADGPCNEADTDQTAFVQGAIIDPATGKVSVYDPLVIDEGTTPAVAPTPPTLPAHAIVALWFGYNGDTLTLRDGAHGRTLARNSCVSGLRTRHGFSSFTQVAYCNAVEFFSVANRAIRKGKLTVPSPGTATDGLACMTTRSFALIDQDQSDNVTTKYLATSTGQIAQYTAANLQAVAGATPLVNGSDNGLLDFHVDPALGCTPWEAPNLADNGAVEPALPLDEIQAAKFAGASRADPAALVPLNDPMTTIDGRQSWVKTDLYRVGADMPLLPAGQTPRQYCADMERVQGARLQQDVNLLIGQASPDAADSNLFTFMADRLNGSYENLGCTDFGVANDVSISADADGVGVAACFVNQVKPLTPGAGNPTAGQTVCPATAGDPAPAASASPSPSASATASASPASASPSPSADPSASAPVTATPTPSASPSPSM